MLWQQQSAAMAGQQTNIFAKLRDVIQEVEDARHDFNIAPSARPSGEDLTRRKVADIISFFSG